MSVQNNVALHKPVLLIDAGNSRIKACIAENSQLTAFTQLVEFSDVSALLNSISRCLISAVGQSKQLQQIITLLTHHGIAFEMLQTSSQHAGLHCGYKDFERLGVDRWLAMLACKQRYTGDFAVLDFGTAMTCDVVNSQGQHLGGWIAPGYATMKSALIAQTERLSIHGESPTQLQLANNTEDCIDMGALASVQGFLLSAVNYMQGISTDYRIFVGGGDYSKLGQLAHPNVETLDHLVFKGMQTFI